MTERALSFGSVAAAYEQFRRGYPEELVDAVLAYAGRPVRTALEIGAGTGKATRVFAARGIAVTATDPDAAMLAELRRHVPSTVTTVRAALEDLEAHPVHDLVFVAAALHWTQPEGRWQRIAAQLGPTGVFASFGGQLHLADPDVDEAVAEVRSQVLASDDVPSPDGTTPDSPMQWPGTELQTCAAFTDVRHVRLPRRLEESADDYVGHLSTISAYLELPERVRTRLLADIAAVLPPRVTLVGDVTLHLARLAQTIQVGAKSGSVRPGRSKPNGEVSDDD
jgi:SAM-dependent methyltransferase